MSSALTFGNRSPRTVECSLFRFRISFCRAGYPPAIPLPGGCTRAHGACFCNMGCLFPSYQDKVSGVFMFRQVEQCCSKLLLRESDRQARGPWQGPQADCLQVFQGSQMLTCGCQGMQQAFCESWHKSWEETAVVPDCTAVLAWAVHRVLYDPFVPC